MTDDTHHPHEEQSASLTEHPKAADLRRANRWMICFFAVGAVVVGVVTHAFEAFLVTFGLMSATIAASVLIVESGGLLPSGSSPPLARRWMVRLLSMAALLGVISVLLLAPHAATVPAVAALACSVSAGTIGARLLTR
jgi:hypothetical protein